MKSRRVRRRRVSDRQAQDAVEVYRLSSRGLRRVLGSFASSGGLPVEAAASRAARHLAGVEALLPKLREAIRSCRYPGAEHGDPGALVWGLWSQLSETLLHVRGAVQSLEVLGAHYRYRDEDGDARDGARATGRGTRRNGGGRGARPRRRGEGRIGAEGGTVAKKRKAKKKKAKKRKAKKRRR